MDRSPCNALVMMVMIVALIGFFTPAILITPVRGDSPSEIAAAYIQKGDDLTLRKEYLQALSAYEAAVESDPYNSIAWNKLGVAHMNTGRYQDAVGAFDKALTIDPLYPDAWNNKGDSHAMLGAHEAAIASYDQALRLNPNDLYALLKKGTVLQESGSPADAMFLYQEVVSLAEKQVRKHPDYARFDAKLWSNKGEALSRLGRYEEAVEAYSVALSINPKYERAIQGKVIAEDEILRARGSPPTAVPETEERGVDIGLTSLPLHLSIILAALGFSALIMRKIPKKK